MLDGKLAPLHARLDVIGVEIDIGVDYVKEMEDV